jgi:EAL domain-containing protein (putative c-di-GMP-specific phosphodiesterase class I)
MLIYKTLGEQDLHQAFDKREFSLAYQPIMNLKSDGFETFEAFIRWHHPTLGTLPPSIFINNLEKLNLHERMTDYIFNAAVTQIMNNFKYGYGETGVNINLTPQEFYNPNTLVQLEKAIKKLPHPEFFGLEISPKILTSYIEQDIKDPHYHPDAAPSDMEMKFLETIRVISNQYRDLGVTLALDTTNYVIGSLIRADILGFHVIKINAQSLQRALFTDINMLNQYVQASEDFQIPLVAVGIETENLFKLVHDNNISYAQGLLLCPPLCLEEPKKFQGYLNTYFNTKKNLMEMEETAQTLKTIASDLSTSMIYGNINSDSDNNKIVSMSPLKIDSYLDFNDIEKQEPVKTSMPFDIPKINIMDLSEDTPQEYHSIQAEDSSLLETALQNPLVKQNFNNRLTFGNRQIFGKKQQS